jgi:hypothetical protein
VSSYELSPAGSGSKVTWTFAYESGSSPFKRWKALMLDGLCRCRVGLRPSGFLDSGVHVDGLSRNSVCQIVASAV